MVQFDWIDFGVWDKCAYPELAKIGWGLHTSTTSLLSQLIRRRPFVSRKIFVALADSGAAVTRRYSSSTYWIDAGFDLVSYKQQDDAGKLEHFARWLLETLVEAAPDLISISEAEVLFQLLKDNRYIYVREERAAATGLLRTKHCTVQYRHSPEEVQCRIISRRHGVNLLIPEMLFKRDEMVYGRAIRRCEFARTHVVVWQNSTSRSYQLDGAG